MILEKTKKAKAIPNGSAAAKTPFGGRTISVTLGFARTISANGRKFETNLCNWLQVFLGPFQYV